MEKRLAAAQRQFQTTKKALDAGAAASTRTHTAGQGLSRPPWGLESDNQGTGVNGNRKHGGSAYDEFGVGISATTPRGTQVYFPKPKTKWYD